MAYGIITTANARRDIQSAVDWENKRSIGLAHRFLDELEQKLTSISISPFIWSVRYENVRCAVTDVFSYLVHYTVDEEHEQVIILRVLHTSRRPVW